MLYFERAKMEDAQKLANAELLGYQEEIAMYQDIPGFVPPRGYGMIEEHEKHIQHSTYYKIMDDDNIIGGVILFDKGDEIYLYKIFLIPSLQNQGIGSKTIHFVENALFGAKKWTLHTPYKSYRNHHFYEKFEYKKVGETQPSVVDGFCLYVYEKYGSI